MSITNLSITNLNAGDSGLVVSDLSIAFDTITIANGHSLQDGVDFSFTGFGVYTANVTRPGNGATPAEVDLTALANYDATSTSLYLAPDNVSDKNRWSVAAITVEVTAPAAAFTTAVLLGDVNLDSEVSFSDISPFIELLVSGDFQVEADCDENGEIGFLDISPFITILSGP